MVAREQMRHATSMESAAADRIMEEMDLVSKKGDKSYHDVADEDAVPSVEPQRSSQGSLPHTSSMDVDAAAQPLVNLDPAVLRAVRVPSRCTDCGRFGHPCDPGAPVVPALPAPSEPQDAAEVTPRRVDV